MCVDRPDLCVERGGKCRWKWNPKKKSELLYKLVFIHTTIVTNYNTKWIYKEK
jgi:hypothetical protein